MTSKNYVSLNEVKTLEGYKIIFKKDDTMLPRKGIITDIFPQNKQGDVYSVIVKGTAVNVVVLWDTDEVIRVENGKTTIVVDEGVSTFSLSEILNPDKFQILHHA